MASRRKPWCRANRNTYYVTVGGTQHNLHTADEDEAHRRWHKLLCRDVRSEVDDPSCITVAAILALFLEWAEKHTEPSTYEWYRRYLKSFRESVSRDRRVSQLKKHDVTDWCDAHSDWGASGTRGAIGAIKRAFNWVEDQGYIPHSPVAGVKKPRLRRRETILTQEQVSLVIAEASDEAFRDLLTVAAETGCRPQEIRDVEARHCDLKEGCWRYAPEEHKTGERTGESRTVYLTPKALEIVAKRCEQHPEGTIFRNSRGKPWTRNAVRSRLKRMRKRLPLPDTFCLYTLRHTYATEALANGVHPEELRILLGHSDLTMVTRHYSHLAKKRTHMKEAALRARGQSAS